MGVPGGHATPLPLARHMLHAPDLLSRDLGREAQRQEPDVQLSRARGGERDGAALRLQPARAREGLTFELCVFCF